jgi:hypothetical protein
MDATKLAWELSWLDTISQNAAGGICVNYDDAFRLVRSAIASQGGASEFISVNKAYGSLLVKFLNSQPILCLVSVNTIHGNYDVAVTFTKSQLDIVSRFNKVGMLTGVISIACNRKNYKNRQTYVAVFPCASDRLVQMIGIREYESRASNLENIVAQLHKFIEKEGTKNGCVIR